MKEEIEKALNNNVTRDLCRKAAKDVRETAMRTVRLGDSNLQKAFVMAEVAKQMVAGASAALSYHFKDTMSARVATNLIMSYVEAAMEKEVKSLENEYGKDKPVAGAIQKMTRSKSADIISALMERIRGK